MADNREKVTLVEQLIVVAFFLNVVTFSACNLVDVRCECRLKREEGTTWIILDY